LYVKREKPQDIGSLFKPPPEPINPGPIPRIKPTARLAHIGIHWAFQIRVEGRAREGKLKIGSPICKRGRMGIRGGGRRTFKISPDPSFPKRGILPFGKGREGGILSSMSI
jgi:hypothetical protein